MLHSISLQNFRSYKKHQFTFTEGTTVIVGQNTAGKTNLIESIFLLATGKSFRGRDVDMVAFGQAVSRVKGKLEEGSAEELEVVIGFAEDRLTRKFLVNDVSRRRSDFVGHLPAVLFTPNALEIITAGPSVRRAYLDTILEQTDSDYRHAVATYEKALRQRNRLLEEAKKQRRKQQAAFDYWDGLLVSYGAIITQKREEYIDHLNAAEKTIFPFQATYDKSIISKERLLQYEQAEIESGMTLVGPQRDEVLMLMHQNTTNVTNITNNKNRYELKELKVFGSRGQQRLAVLELKAIELSYVETCSGEKPLLLLDDMFSELDENHIRLVLHMTKDHQTIMTTTHREFIRGKAFQAMSVVELE